MTLPHFDAIVIGLGAIGAATFYQLAQRGIRVLGIDQFNPPHDLGSSHGESRISRLAIGEGDEYVPLVHRSHQVWRELEARTGRSIFVNTGGLIMAPRDRIAAHHGKSDFVRRTIACAQRHDIAHEVLDAAGVRQRYPQFHLQGDELGYLERDAGFVRPEQAIAAQIESAVALGGTLRTHEQVLAIHPVGNGDTVEVHTAQGRYTTNQVVVATGQWLPGFLGQQARTDWNAAWGSTFGVYRQVMHWFDTGTDAPRFAPGTLPVFIWMFGDDQEDYMYGFPSSDPTQRALKVASEQYFATTSPADIDRTVSAEETTAMFQVKVAPRFPGLSGQVLQAKACMYTVTPDRHFVIDSLPGAPNILIASACSGHGFKHSAGVGDAVARQVLGLATPYDLHPFSIARFGTHTAPIA